MANDVQGVIGFVSLAFVSSAIVKLPTEVVVAVDLHVVIIMNYTSGALSRKSLARLRRLKNTLVLSQTHTHMHTHTHGDWG